MVVANVRPDSLMRTKVPFGSALTMRATPELFRRTRVKVVKVLCVGRLTQMVAMSPAASSPARTTRRTPDGVAKARTGAAVSSTVAWGACGSAGAATDAAAAGLVTPAAPVAGAVFAAPAADDEEEPLVATVVVEVSAEPPVDVDGVDGAVVEPVPDATPAPEDAPADDPLAVDELVEVDVLGAVPRARNITGSLITPLTSPSSSPAPPSRRISVTVRPLIDEIEAMLIS